MQVIVNIVKQSLHPATATTIVVLVAIGAVLLYVRGGRWGRRWITTLALGYWLMSTPACASWIEWPLTRSFSAVTSIEQAAGARAIVLLSAGTFTFRAGPRSLTTLPEDSARRTMEAARLYNLLGKPTVIASGGKPLRFQVISEARALADGLTALGVAPGDVALEEESKTTYDEAVLIAPMLSSRQVDRFLLVTSAVHMRRSMAVFEAQGLHPIAAPSTAEIEEGPGWLSRISWYLPSRRALLRSDAALYEYAGLLYYRSKGRLRAPGI